LEPQEPHAPPQQPPPPPCSFAKSREEEDNDSLPPAIAKLETSTLVLVDSQDGQIWALSRSANLVRTSNFPEQLSHRYS
jgi:hypothetical protein